jgi:outer membrane protein assembly factor BamB
VNGVVYVGDERTNIAAYDAAGSTNCSGTPKVCAPLWTATDTGAVEGTIAVANGRAYVAGGGLQVYDAAGSTNCSGTPTTCTPLWTYATSGGVEASPALANGVLYEPAGQHELDAFDATGVTNCSGTPVTCSALWTASIGSQITTITSSPAVANGVVYVGSYGQTRQLYAFDATTGAKLWSAAIGSLVDSCPAVANGAVYIGSDNHKLYAFRIAGR